MDKAIFWHRRDLRIEDNAGLFMALKSGHWIQPIFIFDTTILDRLPENDQRVIFIHQQIQSLQKAYNELGADLIVGHGNPTIIIPQIAAELKVKMVFTNRDYEPDALVRDKLVFENLTILNIGFKSSKDHVIFEKNEVLKPDGLPYTIFTPYMKKWKEKLTGFYLQSYPVFKYASNLELVDKITTIPSLEDLHFKDTQTVVFPPLEINTNLLKNYQDTRDFPAIEGTSRLSLHLRFGTISIRTLAQTAQSTNEKYFNELIWRDFYQMILFHFPHSAKNSFRKIYDYIEWENNESYFNAWCEGKTGYPLVDAGMRELNTTGHMHNRVRMVVASFLCKHLLIDWRWGAAYFAEKLLDFELSSNAGGWQWAAGSGCDAAPYFRVFNPQLQLEKFDKNLQYVKKWVPELNTKDYPPPIVDHNTARIRAIETYKKGLNKI